MDLVITLVVGAAVATAVGAFIVGPLQEWWARRLANGPPADLQAAIRRPDGTHRRVALKPLDVPRPPP